MNPQPPIACRCVAGKWERLRNSVGTDYLVTTCPKCGTKFVFALDDAGNPTEAVALPPTDSTGKPDIN